MMKNFWGKIVESNLEGIFVALFLCRLACVRTHMHTCTHAHMCAYARRNTAVTKSFGTVLAKRIFWHAICMGDFWHAFCKAYNFGTVLAKRNFLARYLHVCFLACYLQSAILA